MEAKKIIKEMTGPEKEASLEKNSDYTLLLNVSFNEQSSHIIN